MMTSTIRGYVFAFICLTFASLQIAAGLPLGTPASAATATTVTKLTDTNDGICDADCSLREAIAVTAPNGSINFAPGLTGTITLGRTLIISKDVTINGSETQPIIISGNNSVRVFYVNSGIHFTIRNLTIAKGKIRGEAGAPGPKTILGTNGQNAGGGALFNNGGIVTAINCTFSGNSALGGNGAKNLRYYGGGAGGNGVGGALYSSGTLYLVNCTFSENKAMGGSGGDVDAVGITFIAGNGGNGLGGAIYTAYDAWISNCTFFGNKAEGGSGGTSGISHQNGHQGVGGGNAIYRPGALAEKNSLVINRVGSITMKNSILAGASSGSNCDAAIKSEGYNIDSDGSCRLKAAGDRSNLDPTLDSLKNNGGPTLTHALLPESPAIDGGNPAGCTDHKGNAILTDQRGHARPAENRCDIGAFEASLP